MRLNFLNKPWAGFALVFCLSTLITVLVLEQYTHAARAREWVRHTYEVLSRINALSGRLTEAESNQRGFSLSGRDIFLKTYNSAVRPTAGRSDDVQSDMRDLADLVRDNPLQQERLRILVKAVQAKLAFMDMIVDVVKSKSPMEAQRYVTGGHGYYLMQDVYAVLSDMRVEESRLLAQRIAEYHDTTRYSLIFTLFLVLLLFTTMAGALLSSGKEYKRRLASEKSLREMASFHSAILDSSFYGIIVADTTGIIRLVNPAVEKMLGYEPGELIGKNGPETLHDPQELAERAQQLSVATGHAVTPDLDVFTTLPLVQESEEREWTYIGKDGRRIPVLVSVTVLRDEKGEVSGFMGVIQDITERRQIEKMKNEFISTVSHELRTPLTSIRGSLALITGNAVGVLPEKAAQLVAIAHKNTERLVRLINNILDIEKIESGHIVFERKPVLVGALLSQALHESEGLINENGLTITIESDCNDAVVIGDMDRLLQVLMNLLSNAAKFSPLQGQVILAARRVDGSIEISVKDEGAGIPDSFRSRIFTKFAQADSQDTRQKGGSGLGLSISKAIVESMDGTLAYTSQPGETIFTTRLPEAARNPQAVLNDKDRARPHILICEDDHDISTLLGMILEREGFCCSVAHTAREAKDLLARNVFTAMTLDIELPDGNGLELIRELREKDSTRNLPIIVISAQRENHQVLEANAIGIVDWVTKPIDQERLRNALQSLGFNSIDRPSVLHIEDDHDITQFLASAMDDVDIVAAPTLAAARAKLQEKHYDLAVLDVYMPDGNGLDLLPELSARQIPVVILSVNETSRDIQAYVAGSMVKTVVSEKKIIETIKTFIGRK